MNFRTLYNQSNQIEQLDNLAEILQYTNETKLSDYQAWANATIVKETVHPLTEKPFAELFEMGTSKRGQPQVVLFPENESVSTPRNSIGALSAFMDGFGLQRYNARMESTIHMRLFDPQNPNERSVLSQLEADGLWKRYDWVGDQFLTSTPAPNTKKLAYWLAKHRELSLILKALNRGFQYRITLFDDFHVSKFTRWYGERLEMTVSEAIQAKSEDAATAQANADLQRGASAVARDAKASKPAPEPIVDDVDLRNITEVTEVAIERTDITNVITITLDPADKEQFAVSIAKVQGALGNPINTLSLNNNG